MLLLFLAVIAEGVNGSTGDGCDSSVTRLRILPRNVERRFVRTDANADALINIADPVAILFHLFAAARLPCEDAADFDDDGVLHTTDAVAILGHLFLGTGPPRPPAPECGPDVEIDGLACDAFAPCE